MGDLGLNEEHQSIVKSYMQFAKYQRNKNLKFIDMSFEDVIEVRLIEATYTKDEVQELLDNLKDLVRVEVEAELLEFSHTNVLLFAQLLNQAEKWHLRMNVDLSEIQNRELLDKVKVLEETEGNTGHERRKLQPLAESSGTMELLRIEIERLKEDNSRLDSTLQTNLTKVKELENENLQLKTKFDAKEEEINNLIQKTSELQVSEENKEKHEVKDESEDLLGEYEKVLRDQLSLELESMRREMLSVQSQLSLAEQELERKFNQTAAYTNMKLMINKKNDQVKELRSQLQKYQVEEETQ